MQVLYGERDLFDPAYLSDPMLPWVLPASYIGWCRSPEGQWFHQVLSEALLPKVIAESTTLQRSGAQRAPFIPSPSRAIEMLRTISPRAVPGFCSAPIRPAHLPMSMHRA